MVKFKESAALLIAAKNGDYAAYKELLSLVGEVTKEDSKSYWIHWNNEGVLQVGKDKFSKLFEFIPECAMCYSDLPEACWFSNFNWNAKHEYDGEVLYYNQAACEVQQGFVELVFENESEYIKRGGWVTCEFSAAPLLPEQLQILEESNQRLKSLGAKWSVFICETCRGYSPNNPYHLMIEKDVSPSS